MKNAQMKRYPLPLVPSSIPIGGRFPLSPERSFLEAHFLLDLLLECAQFGFVCLLQNNIGRCVLVGLYIWKVRILRANISLVEPM
jgi:hypothetical protein